MSVPARPVWLDEDAEIGALLNAVLDRFDRQPGESRERNVTLPAEKHLPSLAKADAQADQSWGLLNELARLGVLRIRPARRSPYDPEWQGAKLAFPPESEPVLRAWLGREWSEPALQVWRRAVQAHAQHFADGGAALLNRRIVIGNRSPEDIVAALATIARISEPVSLRQLSASVFWGDSKVLDDRGDVVAALFPALQIRERAGVVAVYLPERCEGTLFIENQDTYIAATLGEPSITRSLALVYASGFRGTAMRVRSRAGALLHFAGPGAAGLQSAFDAWWYDGTPALGFDEPQCWFWGDLDFAGMQILKALRLRFPSLTAWQPGYTPLLAALVRCGGYRPFAVEDRGQLDPGTTGCAYADSALLPAIRQHGQLDQEFMS
jgi:hypothetical protein